MILLDSSILIELFRKKEKRNTSFYKLNNQYNKFYISSVTFYEVGIGNRRSHIKFWEELSENLNVIPFDKVCSGKAIDIYLELLKKNQLIDIADIFIGATALTYKLPVATLNMKHFNRIDGLELVG